VAINEAYAATQWVAEHGAEIKVDGKRLAVAGNSVGGNMAAVVALMAKNKGTPAIRYQVLFWPVTNANFENASYDEFSEGHFLTRSTVIGMSHCCRQRFCDAGNCFGRKDVRNRILADEDCVWRNTGPDFRAVRLDRVRERIHAGMGRNTCRT